MYVQVKRDRATGRRLENVLVETSTFQETSKTSYSLTRTPGPRNESIKGSSTNLPFLPGGFELDEKNNFSFSGFLGSDSDDKDKGGDADEEKLFEELFDKSKIYIKILLYTLHGFVYMLKIFISDRLTCVPNNIPFVANFDKINSPSTHSKPTFHKVCTLRISCMHV